MRVIGQEKGSEGNKQVHRKEGKPKDKAVEENTSDREKDKRETKMERDSKNLENSQIYKPNQETQQNLIFRESGEHFKKYSYPDMDKSLIIEEGRTTDKIKKETQ